jgi:hypothetical protein
MPTDFLIIYLQEISHLTFHFALFASFQLQYKDILPVQIESHLRLNLVRLLQVHFG